MALISEEILDGMQEVVEVLREEGDWVGRKDVIRSLTDDEEIEKVLETMFGRYFTALNSFGVERKRIDDRWFIYRHNDNVAYELPLTPVGENRFRYDGDEDPELAEAADTAMASILEAITG